MTPTDVFNAQLRVDQFRQALGNIGARLDRTAELDQLLDDADAHGWTPAEIGQHIAARLPRVVSSPNGLVVVKLRDLARTVKPQPPHPHAVAAAARAFVQPLPPCGYCDGTPARWRDVTPADHQGQAVVEHCPNCWTPPPGYTPPRRAYGPYPKGRA